MHWAIPYLGIRWAADGEGPPEGGDPLRPDRATWRFNCWSFVRFANLHHYDRILPPIPDPGDPLRQARRFRDHAERRRWRPVVRPDDGDCVLLRQARYPVHIGIFVPVDGGKVVHCSEALGVEAPRLAALPAAGWQVEGFYRFQGDRP